MFGLPKNIQYNLRWCRAARLCCLFVHGRFGHSFWRHILAVSVLYVVHISTFFQDVRRLASLDGDLAGVGS
jgi:hypothetical protein